MGSSGFRSVGVEMRHGRGRKWLIWRAGKERMVYCNNSSRSKVNHLRQPIVQMEPSVNAGKKRWAKLKRAILGYWPHNV